jgi:hypothetical protein
MPTCAAPVFTRPWAWARAAVSAMCSPEAPRCSKPLPPLHTAQSFHHARGTPPPNPAELLASSNMRDLIAELRGMYDHIVIDTPPTLSVTDAVVLSPRADATILVIRSGQTTKQALRRARDILMQVNAHVAGVLAERRRSHLARLLLLLRVSGESTVSTITKILPPRRRCGTEGGLSQRRAGNCCTLSTIWGA